MSRQSEKSPGKGLTANLLLLVISLGLALLVLEAGLRGFLGFLASEDTFLRYASYQQLQKKFENSGRYTPHLYLGFALTPDFEDRANRHNNLGFRGEEIPLQKIESEFRIICIGGSTTYSSGVNDFRDSYPYLLQKRLRDLGFKDVRVINSGTPGWTTWESLVNFQFRLLDLAPDLILIYHGVNDVGPRLVWPREKYSGDNSGARAISFGPDTWPKVMEQSTLVRMLLIRTGKLLPHSDQRRFVSPPATTGYGDDFQEQTRKGTYPSGLFVEVPVRTMLEINRPSYYRRNLESLSATAKQRGIEVVLATFTHLKREQPGLRSSWNTPEYWIAIEEHNEILGEISVATGSYLFDFAAVFPKEERYFSRIRRWGEEFTDIYHLNAPGNELKAKMFADFLSENELIPQSNNPGKIEPHDDSTSEQIPN